MACMQVMDAAMEAGADDVQPATGENDAVEGFKVQHFLSLPSFPAFPKAHEQLRISGQGREQPGLKEPVMSLADVIPSCTQLLK